MQNDRTKAILDTIKSPTLHVKFKKGDMPEDFILDVNEWMQNNSIHPRVGLQIIVKNIDAVVMKTLYTMSKNNVRKLNNWFNVQYYLLSFYQTDPIPHLKARLRVARQNLSYWNTNLTTERTLLEYINAYMRYWEEYKVILNELQQKCTREQYAAILNYVYSRQQILNMFLMKVKNIDLYQFKRLRRYQRQIQTIYDCKTIITQITQETGTIWDISSVQGRARTYTPSTTRTTPYKPTDTLQRKLIAQIKSAEKWKDRSTDERKKREQAQRNARQRNNRQRFNKDATKQKLQNITCYKCGKKGHYSNTCPNDKQATVVCYNCGKVGHKADKCRSTKQSKPPTTSKNYKDAVCSYCHKKGHTVNICWAKKKSNTLIIKRKPLNKSDKEEKTEIIPVNTSHKPLMPQYDPQKIIPFNYNVKNDKRSQVSQMIDYYSKEPESQSNSYDWRTIRSTFHVTNVSHKMPIINEMLQYQLIGSKYMKMPISIYESEVPLTAAMDPQSDDMFIDTSHFHQIDAYQRNVYGRSINMIDSEPIEVIILDKIKVKVYSKCKLRLYSPGSQKWIVRTFYIADLPFPIVASNDYMEEIGIFHLVPVGLVNCSKDEDEINNNQQIYALNGKKWDLLAPSIIQSVPTPIDKPFEKFKTRIQKNNKKYHKRMQLHNNFMMTRQTNNEFRIRYMSNKSKNSEGTRIGLLHRAQVNNDSCGLYIWKGLLMLLCILITLGQNLFQTNITNNKTIAIDEAFQYTLTPLEDSILSDTHKVLIQSRVHHTFTLNNKQIPYNGRDYKRLAYIPKIPYKGEQLFNMHEYIGAKENEYKYNIMNYNHHASFLNKYGQKSTQYPKIQPTNESISQKHSQIFSEKPQNVQEALQRQTAAIDECIQRHRNQGHIAEKI